MRIFIAKPWYYDPGYKDKGSRLVLTFFLLVFMHSFINLIPSFPLRFSTYTPLTLRPFVDFVLFINLSLLPFAFVHTHLNIHFALLST